MHSLWERGYIQLIFLVQVPFPSCFFPDFNIHIPCPKGRSGKLPLPTLHCPNSPEINSTVKA